MEKRKKEIKLMFVVASRPNFMKVAPLVKEAKKQKVNFCIFYTEQHKKEEMSKIFFEELGIPDPDFRLDFKKDFENYSKFKKFFVFLKNSFKTRSILKKAKPDCVVVVGDVFSSAYVAVIARTLRIKIAHVEAGLRSFNNKMPEEKARKVIDKISDFLFVTEDSAKENLLKEGNKASKIYFVGNIMIDSLKEKIKEAEKRNYYKQIGLKKGDYGVVTFHRHENITNKNKIEKFLDILKEISKKIKLVFPLHPSTKDSLIKFNLLEELYKIENLNVINPIGYIEMLSLVKNSKFVLTDSGGLQEETTFLKIPCLTLRKETERPITIIEGTNTIVDLDINKIKENIENIFKKRYKKGKIPKYWDGKTAERIINILKDSF